MNNLSIKTSKSLGSGKIYELLNIGHLIVVESLIWQNNKQVLSEAHCQGKKKIQLYKKNKEMVVKQRPH